MPNISIRQHGADAIDTTNRYFLDTGLPLVANTLSQQDLEWCMAMVRNLPEEKRLPWETVNASLDDDEAFNFAFKILDAMDRPAGACACDYIQAEQVLNVNMLQNFSPEGSVLDGRMLTYALVTIVFFLVDTEGTGVRLMFPVNDGVADYYINRHQFVDITNGAKLILYRSADELSAWFSTLQLPLVDGE
ncbi:hypothetical protein [Serratia inhibens]|uniref:hypothetical protein n=1 Tax=Serratia inhibens TaxID=2338073 RepID=UPI00025E2480|nr:hypothetical protein [Serratia inhibens]ANS44896.1 hypothetical protein Q5A_022395 [Serratia inhibens PRI-2C]